MSIDQTLKTIGIKPQQARIYLAALELGEASMTELAKQAQYKRPTTYLIVDELLALGLLSETEKGKRRIISATHPRRLLHLVQARQKNMEEIFPELVARYNAPKHKPKIQVFEGAQGLKDVYALLFDSVKQNEEILFYTKVSALDTVPGAKQEFKKLLRHSRRSKIRELNFDEPEARAWLEEIATHKPNKHEVRFLDAATPVGDTDFVVFGNRVALFSLKKDLFVTVIESTDIAQSQRALFEHAWKQGVKITQ